MWNTPEASKNHLLIQEGQGESCREAGALDVPGLREPPFSRRPLPLKYLFSHLLCLAQMVDSAGLFILFFLCKRLFQALFLSPSRPLPLYLQFLSRKEAKLTNGSLKVSLLCL